MVHLIMNAILVSRDIGWNMELAIPVVLVVNIVHNKVPLAMLVSQNSIFQEQHATLARLVAVNVQVHRFV